jgi:hypothetical protein
MCQRITCSTCGKPSFAGCGRHVESVLGNVPPAERCRCRASSAGPAAGAPGSAQGLRGLLGLFGFGAGRKQP